MDKFFLKSIISSELNNTEKIIELLEYRGFLIDKKDEKYYLSDNAAFADIRFLDNILKKYNIGKLLDEKKYLKRRRMNWMEKHDRTTPYETFEPYSVEIIIFDEATVESTINIFDISFS